MVVQESHNLERSTVDNMRQPSSDAQPGLQMKECHKVPGMQCKNQANLLTFEFSDILASAGKVKVLTKREILRIAAKFYDPLGLFAPLTVFFSKSSSS